MIKDKLLPRAIVGLLDNPQDLSIGEHIIETTSAKSCFFENLGELYTLWKFVGFSTLILSTRFDWSSNDFLFIEKIFTQAPKLPCIIICNERIEAQALIKKITHNVQKYYNKKGKGKKSSIKAFMIKVPTNMNDKTNRKLIEYLQKMHNRPSS